MVTIPLYRQQAEDLQQYFFPYFKQLKVSNVSQVAHLSVQSGEFLTVVAVNCIMDEVMLCVNKKLINTSGAKINLKLSDAQAVIFNRLLIQYPVTADQWHLLQLCRYLVDVLDKELIKHQIINSGKAMQNLKR